MTCSSRAQICSKISIRDSRTSSTEIESDCFFVPLEDSQRWWKANGKQKDIKREEHSKKQRRRLLNRGYAPYNLTLYKSKNDINESPIVVCLLADLTQVVRRVHGPKLDE